jgi:hypothetical protein
VFDIDT